MPSRKKLPATKRAPKKKSSAPSRSSTTRSPLWTSVDEYIASVVAPSDAILDAAVQDAKRAGLPDIAVTASLGKLLHVLARTVSAKRILEIGTLAGYSTLWMARALPSDGKLVTLEYDATHAGVAAKNIDRAGLSKNVDILLGAALDLLPKLKVGSFDLTFIDADKQNIPAYFDWAVKLSRPGALIVVDNVIRDGKVLDAKSADANVLGVRRFNDQLRKDSRVSAATMQTVGAKGHDGFTIAVVL